MADGGTIACDLCYRRCVLTDGQDGWCKIRGNRDGRMVLHQHGVLSGLVAGRLGYGEFQALRTYKPGQTKLSVGGVGCTARCVFCCESNIAWNPDKVAWLRDDQRPNHKMQWHFFKARVTPEQVIETALRYECRAIEFEVNEPLLTIEHTADVARLAKQHGMDVVIFTNGFSGAEPVRQLAPLVDAVYFGLKGSADPAFYERHMRGPGAVPHVLEALKAWYECGVHTVVGDVLAAPPLQSDEAQAEAQRQFFAWLTANLGDTVMYQPMIMCIPEVTKQQQHAGHWGEPRAIRRRTAATIRRAFSAGLQYVLDDPACITCHECNEPLVKFYAPVRPGQPLVHRQWVTDSHCDHCGATVPVIVLPHNDVPAVNPADYEPGAGMHLFSLMGFL